MPGARRVEASDGNSMATDLRKTGIDVLGQVPWGTHLCQFYQSAEDLSEILVPYFKAGLESNEFCMWICSEPLVTRQARKALDDVSGDLAVIQRCQSTNYGTFSRTFPRTATLTCARR